MGAQSVLAAPREAERRAKVCGVTTVVDVLRRRGVDVDEQDLVDAADEGLHWVLTSSGGALPAREAALLDAGGLMDEPGAYARAAASAVSAAATLTAQSLTVAEAARMLGISEGRVRHRIASLELYALPTGRRRLPRWQFHADEPLPGLPIVLRALPRGLHPLAVLSLLSAPQPELVVDDRPMSSLEWLATGGDPAVVVDLVATPA